MESQKVIRVTPEGAKGVPLTPCAFVPAETVIDGDPKEQAAIMLSSGDDSFMVGVWESTPYAETFDGYPSNEFCHVLKGKATLTDLEGQSHTFVAGDSYIVPKGFRGTFRVEETFRKYFVLSSV